MRFWTGVVTNTVIDRAYPSIPGKNRRRKAFIKDPHSGVQICVPYETNALVEINLHKMTLVDAEDDAPWADEQEQEQVEIGTEVVLTTEVEHFPTDASQVLSINFRRSIRLVLEEASGPMPQTGIVVIYHDFRNEQTKGDSGEAFAKSVEAWAQKLSRPCWLIKADTTLSATYASLDKLAKEKKGLAVVDTILIVTHGRPGELYIGDPNNVNDENFIRETSAGENFKTAQTFGTKLRTLFGTNLAIGIYSCNFLDNDAGQRMAVQLRTSSGARAVYASTGQVDLMPNMGQRPVALCQESYVVFATDKITSYVKKEIPVFDI